MSPRALTTTLLALLLAAAAARADDPLVVERWLVLEAPDKRGRRPFNPSAVEAEHLLSSGQTPPRVGDVLVGERGVECTWRAVEADARGAVPAAGAWAYARLEHDVEEVLLARLSRAARLWVNGERVVGDLYDAGFGALPVALRAGTNHLFVDGVRGDDFALAFERPAHDLLLPTSDDTKPDLIAGEPIDTHAAVLVVNATRFWARDVVVELDGGALVESARVRVPDGLPPCGVTKVAIPLRGVPGARVPERGEVAVALACGPARRRLVLDVVQPGDLTVRTFLSGIDASVQEYALLAPTSPDAAPPGLALSLHGAGVRAARQLEVYSAKPDLWLVAPMNRRPFGFDWQDWGRLDAYEALADALAVTGADPDRVCLTGHSMGGHGVWHLAVNDPDRFAAIAPSSGWAGFDTYASRPEGSWSFLWHGADAASDTHDLVGNLRDVPTYVLHGADDRSVPRAESEGLSAALSSLRVPHTLHVQPDVGHWWDGERAAGVDCVDWPPIFEMFADARRARDPERIAFRSASPSVDARHHWVVVDQVLAAGRFADVEAAFDEETGRVTVTTANVRRLRVDPPDAWSVRELVVDGQAVAMDGAAPWAARRDGATWRAAPPEPPAGEKRAGCSGPFKCVFTAPFVLVVGTGGNPGRDELLLSRARDDAARWWYRGNGRAPIVTDEEFLVGAFDGRWRDGHVVLYGNALTNRAWAAVLGPDRPIDVVEGALRIGDERLEGDDLAALVVRPRADAPDGLVGVFAGTGPVGARLTGVVPVFVSGVGVPDYVVFDADVLRRGDDGVRAAGFFEADWSLRRR